MTFNNSTISYDYKIKQEKNINNSKYLLYFIEETISDKFLLEEKIYDHFFYYCSPYKQLGKIFISEKSKNELKINNNIVIELHNSYFEGEEDELKIHNETKPYEPIKEYSFPLGFSGFALIKNKIFISPAKKKEESGFFYIDFINAKELEINIGFAETRNFKVTSICPLFNLENTNIYYFLVAGIGSQNKIKIKLCKLFKNDKTKFMDAQIIEDNIYNYKDKNFLNIEKPIYYIKQSKENGHIFMYSENKMYHFSSINISKYLEMDEIEKTEPKQYLQEKEIQKLVYHEKQTENSIYSNS